MPSTKWLITKTNLCLNRKSNIHNIPTKNDIVMNKNFDKNEKIIIDVCIPAIKENLFYDLPNLLISIKIQTLQPRSIHIYLSDVSDMTCRDSQKKLQQIVNVPLNIYCANKKRRQGIARNMLARMVHKTYAKQHVLTFIDADDKMHKRRIEIISYIFETYNPKMMLNSYFDMSKKNRISKSIYSLISNVNNKASVGFFNYCSKLNTIFFSYKISIKGQRILSIEQIQNFIDIVTKECDRFFPVFFVYFYRKQDPIHAIDIALLDTHGEA